MSDTNTEQQTQSASDKYKYILIGVGLSAAIFILAGLSMYFLVNDNRESPQPDSVTDVEEQQTADDADESEIDTEEEDADAVWRVELPENEALAENGFASGNTLVYAAQNRREVTVYERNVTDGENDRLFSYKAAVEADLSSGNLWKGLPPQPALSPDGTQIAYTDQDGLKVYDRTTGDVEPILVKTDKSDTGDVPPIWSDADMKGTFDLRKPQWSPKGTSIGFAQAFFEGSGFGIVNVASGEYTNTDLYAGSVEVDWSTQNTLVQPGRGGYTGEGLRVTRPGSDDVENIAEVFNQGDAWFREARFSPSGGQIVFTHTRGQFPDTELEPDTVVTLAIADQDGSGYQELANGQIHTPFFSADGDTVYFIEHENGQNRLQAYDLQAGAVEVVADLGLESVWEGAHWLAPDVLALTQRRSVREGEDAFVRLIVLDLNDQTLPYVGPVFRWFTSHLGLTQ